jgi:lauroyl/myristoyl acyltransferase
VHLSPDPHWLIGFLTALRGPSDGRSGLLAPHFTRIFPGYDRRALKGLVSEYWRRHNRHTVDLFHLERLRPERLPGVVEWVGREHLDHALALGRGALLLVPHFGDERSMHILMGMAGYSVEVITSRYSGEGDIPRTARLSVGGKWNSLHFPDENPRWMHRALAGNRILHYSPTAYGGPGGVWLDMFGVPDLVPATPWRLVEKTGCAVLFGLCHVLPGMRFRIALEPMDASGNLETFTGRVMSRVERAGLEHPGQYDWKNLVIRHRESNTIARIGGIPREEEMLEKLAVSEDEDPGRVPDLAFLKTMGRLP